MDLLPNARQLGLFTLLSLKNSLRSGLGILFLVGALVTGIGVTAVVLQPIDTLMRVSAEKGIKLSQSAAEQEMVSVTTPVMRWLLGGSFEEESDGSRTDPTGHADTHPGTDAERSATIAKHAQAQKWTKYLLSEQLAPLSAVYMLLCFCLPFLIALGGCDQVSSDIQARRLRFLLVRSNRSTIYFGRALGITVFVAAVLALVLGIVSIYVASTLTFYPPTQIMWWTLRCWALLVISALPSIAVCSLISASFASAFGSLALCNLSFAAVPLVPLIVSATTGAAWTKYFDWLLPLPFEFQLFHYEFSHVALAALGCLGYAAVYLGLGWWIFQKRDL